MKQTKSTPKTEERTYILELTEEQARLVEVALEEYFRLRLGQFSDFADDLAFQGFDYKNHTDDEFRERIHRKDRIINMMEVMKPIIWPPAGLIMQKTEEQNNVIDIWHVIRHVRYLARGGDPNGCTTAADEPFLCGTIRLPKMYVKTEETQEDD